MNTISIPRKNLSWRIRAVFSGKLPPREYLTRDIRHSDPGWGDEVFNRQVESLVFYIPTGHRLVLSGMEAYNFFVEATQDMSQKGGARIEAFHFCGKLPGLPVVDMWRVGDGRIVREQKPFGKEWGGSTTRGWKLGVVGAKPVSAIFQGH